MLRTLTFLLFLGVPSGLMLVATPDDAIAAARDSLARHEYANALDIVLPSPPDMDKLASRSANMYVDGLSAYYAYYASALKHRRDIFDWQLWSSKIIFVVVVFLVITGVAFAGIQFFRDRVVSESTVEASLSGLKVSSRTLGLLILAISFLFFYMYLVHVYPIHESIRITGQ